MRFVTIPLLALGTVVGYAFAFHSMHHHRHAREDWEHHIADTCVKAARGVRSDTTNRNEPRRESPSSESSEP